MVCLGQYIVVYFNNDSYFNDTSLYQVLFLRKSSFLILVSWLGIVTACDERHLGDCIYISLVRRGRFYAVVGKASPSPTTDASAHLSEFVLLGDR
jgi:hypothetical protein